MTRFNKRLLATIGTELQMFYNDTEYIGYIIWDKVNNVICEISLNYPSYIIFMQTKILLMQNVTMILEYIM